MFNLRPPMKMSFYGVYDMSGLADGHAIFIKIVVDEVRLSIRGTH